MNDLLTIILSASALIITIITGIYKLVTNFKKRREWKKEETRNLLRKLGFSNDRDYNYIKSPTFIPTMGQKEAPHDNDDINISEGRFPLVDALLKELLKKDSIEKKRYAILGGSGMGKTTFSASFIYKYINKDIYKKPKYPIYVYYLGNPTVIDEIRQLKDGNSILLLDALDENMEAAKDVSSFMKTLGNVTNDFKHVIITSRTHFFPSKKREPKESCGTQNNPNKESLLYEVVYISPFSKEETETFLGNKFTIPSKEYTKAHKLVDKSEKLMVRPMVLSFIDDLLDLADKEEITTVELYKRIIDGWLSRECKNQKYTNVSELYSFSKKLSLYIYDKWQKAELPHISADEYDAFVKENGYDDSPYSFKDRSLLNRNSEGFIKFSHRSFLEFFIAINALENPGRQFSPKAFDMAPNFFREFYELYLNGIKFENINYFVPCCIKEADQVSPDFSVFQSEIAKLAKNPKRNKTASVNTLWLGLWEIIIQALIYEVLPSDAESMEEIVRSPYYGEFEKIKILKEFTNKLQKANQFYTNLHLLRSHILQYFKSSDSIDINNNITCVANKLNDICKMLNESQNSIPDYYHHFKSKHEFIVFSHLFKMNNEIIEKAQLLNNFIGIGNGLCDDDTLIDTINKVLDYKQRAETICVYRESEDIEETANLIYKISNNIRAKYRFVIVIYDYKGIRIKYIIDNSTKEEVPNIIYNSIKNMIQIKKSIAYKR